jgi:hypothetical protein
LLLRSCQNTHTQIKRRRKSLKQKDATERECVTNGGLKGTKQRTKHSMVMKQKQGKRK